ncbi:uncharacterized protein PAC_16506 [Phialocephala subalpina]|uniref:MARVEL domain-containing protein n=1 Tax=Phialocephala subalpina TaxID=576137 RepID=A0A1L7XNI3_9HELO|nr:uncharacterized protein PAC_16506 [Phialocephala subalpina]
MLFGIFFAFWRFMEIITLIPTLGMLAYFVHIYASNNALTPNYILVLFIVSVLAAAWAIATLFTYHRSKSNSMFVAFIDLCFVGALIAGVYELRGISGQNCTHVTQGSSYQLSGILGSITVNSLHFSANKQCAMLKACFAFGIMNCIFFFITSVLAFFHSGDRDNRRDTTYVRETHVSRHGHRRSGSHRSHRSSHSGRRHAYV